MIYWNYRVIHKIFKNNPVKHTYTIHEVYYDKSDKIEAWSTNPDVQLGETIDELKEDYKMFAEAFGKPILVEKETKEEKENEINYKTILIEEKENK